MYGYGSDFATREPRFLSSDDGGRTWNRLQAPEPLVSLAVSPEDPEALIASGARGVHRSADGGRSWKRVDAPGAGLLAWTQTGVVLVAFDGNVWHGVGTDRWRPAGAVGGEPAAFDHGQDGTLLVALPRRRGPALGGRRAHLGRPLAALTRTARTRVLQPSDLADLRPRG